MIKNLQQIFFSVVILLAGISILLNEAGILAAPGKVSGGHYIFLMLNLLSELLFAVAAYLAWRCYKQAGTFFYKWLAVAITLKVGLWVEELLFSQIDFKLPKPSNSSLLETIHLQLAINRAHEILLQYPGAIIIALLIVYAIGHYGSQVRFFEVFKPRYLRLLCAVFVIGAATYIAAVIRLLGQQNFLYFAADIIMSSLVPVIYLYGIKVAGERMQTYDNTLLKWFIIYFAIGVFSWLTLLVINIISLSWHLPGFMFFIYLTRLIGLVMPMILIAALSVCRNEEGV